MDEDTLGLFGRFRTARLETTRFGDARGRARVIQDYARVFFFFAVFVVVLVGDSSG